jgi:hypothetical protein
MYASLVVVKWGDETGTRPVCSSSIVFIAKTDPKDAAR